LHLEDCNSCREAVAAWELLKQELARIEPLPEASRESWLAAQSGETRVRPVLTGDVGRQNRRVYGFALAAAATVLIAGGLSLRMIHAPGPAELIVEAAPPQEILPAAANERVNQASAQLAMEMTLIESDLGAMHAELASLQARADLLDVRADTSRLLAMYAN
jgi:hypothetical protein